MKKLLLFDFNNLFYRALHVHGELSHKGLFTGGLYGFITQMASTINEVRPDNVIVCTDSQPYLRSKLFPEYKGDRKKNDRTPEELEALSVNKVACKDLLYLLEIPLMFREGLEADDLFALIAKKHSMDNKVIVASNDTDLYQLLDWMTLYRGKEKGYYDKRKFFSEFPHMRKAREWFKVAAIAGSHNGVPQLRKRLGQKTAMKLLNIRGMKGQLDQLLSEHGETYQRNCKLCELPFPGSRQIRFLPKRGVADYRGTVRFLKKFGIEYTAYMSKAFEG